MQRHSVVIACALVGLWTRSMDAQQVSRAYCGSDGKAHIAYHDNSEKTVAVQNGQVGCEHIIVAGDARTIAWSVLVKNCCTSYPIPISVVVYRDGKQRIISPGQMIWDWRFIDKGDRLAILSGPVHGDRSAATLYDTHNAHLLATWEGKGTPPSWASAWQSKFSETP